MVSHVNIECPSTILRSEQARTASFQQTPAKLQEPEACQRLLAFKALSGYFNFFGCFPMILDVSGTLVKSNLGQKK
jgi:hypothetical protein